jgi:hypothetical protein
VEQTRPDDVVHAVDLEAEQRVATVRRASTTLSALHIDDSSFVSRDDSLADLVTTIRAAQGESHVSPRMAPTLLRRVAMTATRRSQARSRHG